MGQAKHRGTFEQRKAEAIELQKRIQAESDARRAKAQISAPARSNILGAAVTAMLIAAAQN